MKMIRAVLLFAPFVLAARAADVPTIYVAGSTTSETGDYGRDVTTYLRRGCHSVTTTPRATDADFTLALDDKVWELKDRQGMTIYTTKQRVLFIGAVAKDVCKYFKTLPGSSPPTGLR